MEAYGLPSSYMQKVPTFARGKTSADIRQEIEAAAEAGQAILATFKARNYENVTDAELAAVDDKIAEVDRLKAELKQAEANETSRQRVAVAHIANTPAARGDSYGTQSMTTTAQFNPQHKAPALKAFTDYREARVAGMMLAASAARARGQRHELAEEFLAGCGDNIRCALTEGAPANGGYLVPDPLASAVINVRATAGISRQICNVIPMTADTLSIPKQTAGPVVRYPGEANDITESDITFGKIDLHTTKRAIYLRMSNELNDDALINMADYVANEFGYQFASQEDAELVLGDSTSTYGLTTGLLSALGAGGVSTAATNHDTWGELDIADVTAWFAKLPSKYSEGAVIVCSQQFYVAVLLRLQASAGGTTMMDLAGGPGNRPLFLGRPCYLTDKMPTATAAATVHALYGNFRQSVALGDRTPFSFAVSPHFLFNSDQLAVRGTTRYDFVVHEPGTASVAGGYVGLKTAS